MGYFLPEYNLTLKISSGQHKKTFFLKTLLRCNFANLDRKLSFIYLPCFQVISSLVLLSHKYQYVIDKRDRKHPIYRNNSTYIYKRSIITSFIISVHLVGKICRINLGPRHFLHYFPVLSRPEAGTLRFPAFSYFPGPWEP